jgi:hypothetical protein
MSCDTCGNRAAGQVYRVEGYDATYTQCYDQYAEACAARGREILQRFYGRDYSPRTQYRYTPKRRAVMACCGGH